VRGEILVHCRIMNLRKRWCAAAKRVYEQALGQPNRR
jgi:hypothetical protein